MEMEIYNEILVEILKYVVSLDDYSYQIVCKQWYYCINSSYFIKLIFDEKLSNYSENIISILDVVDSDGNNWYEVDNLSQDCIFENFDNVIINDPNSTADPDVKKILRLKSIEIINH